MWFLYRCNYFIYDNSLRRALEKEVKIPNEKQIEILSKNSYSSNSKSQVSRNYFSRISKEKLNTIFPYLNAFTNNDYFRNVYNFSNDSREREKDLFKIF
ncbi:hypothetical protein [Mycoplasmopsis arginini]|uniref:hypothetical protein n=1 Tax=Mycoplasmopsis arginini TaxID=2094 RepID=UPI0011B20CBE|nr:hypothetical protein [Mycoplasmopsis arginini]